MTAGWAGDPCVRQAAGPEVKSTLRAKSAKAAAGILYMFDGLMIGLNACYNKPASWRIGFGLAAALGGLALRFALIGILGDGLPYLGLFPAVEFAALLGGLVSGVIAALLSALLACIWILQFGSVVIWAGPATFLLLASFVSLITEAMHRSWLRLSAAEARASQEGRLRTERERLSGELMMTLEAERSQIARELHDSLGQDLTAMNLALGAMSQEFSKISGLEPKLSNLKGLTITAAGEVNRLAWDLRPTVLDDIGLQPAIEQLIEKWSERTKLCFDLHLNFGPLRLSRCVETVLYRIAQEAITNVVKHANAKKVGIILRADWEKATLIVEDDGQGFEYAKPDASRPNAARFGLRGIRERLDLVGGALEIETAPGAGTTLLIRVPFDEASAEPAVREFRRRMV